MPKLKLSYFDFNGGRGDSIRLALTLGEIAFEDYRIPIADWPAVKEETRFRALPLLEIDGEVISQSNAISRYVGKLAGLYPEDLLDAVRCDEVMDAVEDIATQVVVTFGIQDDTERKIAREALMEGPIRLYLERLQELLQDRGGEYFADGRLTVADLKVLVWIQNLRSGVLDYIPKDLVDRIAPELVKHAERLLTHPGILAYYAAH